jgi:hypothetical protein
MMNLSCKAIVANPYHGSIILVTLNHCHFLGLVVERVMCIVCTYMGVKEPSFIVACLLISLEKQERIISFHVKDSILFGITCKSLEKAFFFLARYFGAC